MTEFQNRNRFLELADDMKKHPEAYGGHQELINTIIWNLDHMKYDDFDDRCFDMPKSKMIEDFRALNREDVVDRIMNGDFDQ